MRSTSEYYGDIEGNLQVKNQPIISNVSLICTVYNESKEIHSFIRSLLSMKSLPGEVVIVDGGSTDGTPQIISQLVEKTEYQKRLKLIVDSSCNRSVSYGPVAKGRNVAIKAASNEIIACADAGCIFDEYWLERITYPLLSNPSIDAVGGWYLPDARSLFENCIASFWVIPPESISKKDFIPSSRSLAFRKSIWLEVGGYPEKSITGEDTEFVLRLREAQCKLEMVSSAVVYWRMPASLYSFGRLVYNYGFGDGVNRHLVKNVFYNLAKILITLLLILVTLKTNIMFIVVLIAWWWILVFSKYGITSFRISNIIKFPVIVPLKHFSDIVYVTGYVSGFVSFKKI